MGLQPDTGYHFAVRAMDEAGNHGPISNVVMATTLPPTGAWVAATLPPAVASE